MADSYSIKEVIEKGFDDIGIHLSEIKSELKETKDEVKESKSEIRQTKENVAFQNGRVRLLEDWSKNAQKIIEETSNATDNYKIDRARFWTAIAILTAVCGTVFALGRVAIRSIIKDDIREALSVYEVPNK